MRFSSAFHMPLQPREAARAAVSGRQEVPLPSVPASTPPEVPEDLDQRVRLAGEWQVGEDPDF